MVEIKIEINHIEKKKPNALARSIKSINLTKAYLNNKKQPKRIHYYQGSTGQ